MKKVILIIVINLIGIISFAQNTDTLQSIKYVTLAPDGSVGMTIYNIEGKNIKLESSTDFYKYEILDIKSSETVYQSKNKGKECTFDMSNLINGTYNLRIFTRNFIITSEITILRSINFDEILRNDKIVAQNE